MVLLSFFGDLGMVIYYLVLVTLGVLVVYVAIVILVSLVVSFLDWLL